MGILCRLNQVPSSVDTLLDSFPFLSLQVSRFHDSKATHGDVTPDNLPGQKFLYGYDDIGNREAVTVYGDPNDPNEARTATYTPNLLNQYTQRDVSGAIHAMAWADPNDAVAFDRATDPNNPQAADAYGDYFYRQFLADNSAGPFFDSIETLVNGQPAGSPAGGRRGVRDPYRAVPSLDRKEERDGGCGNIHPTRFCGDGRRGLGWVSGGGATTRVARTDWGRRFCGRSHVSLRPRGAIFA